MNAIFALVASLGIGFLASRRSTAVLVFLVADSFVFTFQSLDVLLNWMAGGGGVNGQGAFGGAPTGFPLDYEQSEVLAYGLVNLVIIVIGIGLTIGANALSARFPGVRRAALVGESNTL